MKYELFTTGEVRNFEELRSYVGRSDAVSVTDVTTGGLFLNDVTDLSSSDDGVNTIVDYKGRRWKRVSGANVSFIQSGTSTVARSVQDKLRDTVSVFDFMTSAQIADVRAGTALVEVTTAIQACLNTAGAAGTTIHFPEGTYLMGRVFPRSNTTIWMDGGVTLQKKTNGINLLRLTNVNNVHIYCNGATLDGSATDSSNQPAVYMEGAVNCSLRDAHVIGTDDAAVLDTGQDCIYIGAGTTNPLCEDVLIYGGSCSNAKRNGISVVAAKRTIIDNVEIFDTTGNPGAGIDVEANDYDELERTEIRHCRIHDNVYGIVASFSDKTKIHNNEIYDNTTDGIATSFAAQFADGVARSNVDIRGVSGFNAANGRVSVGGDLSTLPVGSQVQFSTQNGAAIPVTFQAQTRWVVCSKPTSSTLILGEMLDYNAKTSLSDAGSGTMDADPDLSDITLRCFIEGQCSNIDIDDNTLYGNAEKDIDIGLAVGVAIRNNSIWHSGSSSAIFVDQNNKVRVEGNTVINDGGSSYGIYVNQTSFPSTRGNKVFDFGAGGMYFGGASRGTISADLVHNCGNTGGRAVEIVKAAGVVTHGLTVFNDDLVTSSNGVYSDTTLTNSTFIGVNVKGAGSSNFNSLVIGTNRAVDCVQKDGSYYGGGGQVTQATSKATGVTLNARAGQITTHNASLAANTVVSFTLTNSFIGANDVVLCVRKSGGTANSYEVWVDSIAAGSCVICIENRTGGALAEALVLQYQVVPGAVS